MEQIVHTVDPFVSLLGIFVLAVFVGYYVVWNVTPALHTPLMSVTNAISSVIVVGALACRRGRGHRLGFHHCHDLRLSRPDTGEREYFRRLPRHQPHAGHVQEEGQINVSQFRCPSLSCGRRPCSSWRCAGFPVLNLSRAGNTYGMVGMAIAILTTLAIAAPTNPLVWVLIIGGIAIGGGIGAFTAKRIAMTAMPQLVAAFHSLVGLAAVFVAAAAFYAPDAFGIASARRNPWAEPD